MSYYPTNFYGNYPYNQYQSFPSIPQQQQPSFLQGKIVDSIDVVKATDVPVGGYSVFPKADFSEMYIKSWNNNGTTSILTFKPVEQKEEAKIDTLEILLEKIKVLEEKIDAAFTIKEAPQQPIKRKEF